MSLKGSDSVLMSMPKFATHNLSRNNKFTFDMGQLIPFFKEEVVAGDTFDIVSQMKIDFLAQIKPVMHNVSLYMYYFYCPFRILMDGWKDFMIGETSANQSIVLPYVNATNVAEGSLLDYLYGVPTYKSTDESTAYLHDKTFKVNAMYLRAYDMIWNEFFRNEDVQSEVAVSTANGNDGADATTSNSLLYVDWQHDYFTSCTLHQQYGDSVSFGLTGDVPVRTHSTTINVKDADPVRYAMTDTGLYNDNPQSLAIAGTTGNLCEVKNQSISIDNSYAPTNLYSDMSEADPFSIELLRQSFLLQQFREKLQLSGHKYEEYVRAVYGQVVPNYLIDKPQYLGGGNQPVIFSSVLQTSGTTEASPQGNQSGYASVSAQSHQVHQTFNEPGIILGVCCMKPQTGYYQGIDRKYTRETKYDYLIPDFVGLGDEPIYNKEIFAQGTDDDDGVFGYNDRYAEYKIARNEVHGQFRSSLDFYHLDRKFSSLPTLSDSFLKCQPSTRIFATDETYENHLMAVAGSQCFVHRCLPKMSTSSGLTKPGVI